MQLDGDQVSMLEWGFKGMVGIVFTVGWWMWGRLVATVAQTAQDLTDHKLDVSERYAKKTELDDIKTSLSVIQNDIKELLGRKRAE